MKKLIFISALVLLQACTEPQQQASQVAPKVVQLTEVKAIHLTKAFDFPATVSAVRELDLKFEVSGRLVVENLVEGSQVKKGQTLAQIDPAPFQRKVEESQTRYEDAVRSLNRIQEMHRKSVASQRELDDAKSLVTISKIALENAKQDLSYCTIKAPYDAVIGARYIENNSYIRAGDTIANIQDRSQLYFSFEVPERLMTENAGNRNVKATAFIIGQEDQVFDLQYVEHKTTPDPITQTYDIRFGIDGEVTNLFYPGSRATVRIEDARKATSSLVLPINALVGDKAQGFFVWRFNPANSVVEKVSVEIAELDGRFAVIASGLNEGDKVVSAAVNQMREQLRVKEYQADF